MQLGCLTVYLLYAVVAWSISYLDVPGLHLDHLAVEVKDHTLQISLNTPSSDTQISSQDDAQSQDDTQPKDEGERQGRWIFNEIPSPVKTYKFTLPSSVQTDQIQAELKKGQLFLTLPKSQLSVQHIQVQQGV